MADNQHAGQQDAPPLAPLPSVGGPQRPPDVGPPGRWYSEGHAMGGHHHAEQQQQQQQQEAWHNGPQQYGHPEYYPPRQYMPPQNSYGSHQQSWGVGSEWASQHHQQQHQFSNQAAGYGPSAEATPDWAAKARQWAEAKAAQEAQNRAEVDRGGRPQGGVDPFAAFNMPSTRQQEEIASWQQQQQHQQAAHFQKQDRGNLQQMADAHGMSEPSDFSWETSIPPPPGGPPSVAVAEQTPAPRPESGLNSFESHGPAASDSLPPRPPGPPPSQVPYPPPVSSQPYGFPAQDYGHNHHGGQDYQQPPPGTFQPSMHQPPPPHHHHSHQMEPSQQGDQQHQFALHYQQFQPEGQLQAGPFQQPGVLLPPPPLLRARPPIGNSIAHEGGGSGGPPPGWAPGGYTSGMPQQHMPLPAAIPAPPMNSSGFVPSYQGPGAHVMGAFGYGEGIPLAPDMSFMRPEFMTDPHDLEMQRGPKRAALPSWLIEEIKKKKATAEATASARSASPTGEEVSADAKGEGKKYRKESDSDASGGEDEDEAEAERQQAMNLEIKRILTEILLKVTDELFEEIANEVYDEEQLDEDEGEEKSLVRRKNQSPSSPTLSEDRSTSVHANSKVAVVSPQPEWVSPKKQMGRVVKTVERKPEDKDSGNVSSKTGNVLGLANYGSDNEDEEGNTEQADERGQGSVGESERQIQQDMYAREENSAMGKNVHGEKGQQTEDQVGQSRVAAGDQNVEEMRRKASPEAKVEPMQTSIGKLEVLDLPMEKGKFVEEKERSRGDVHCSKTKLTHVKDELTDGDILEDLMVEERKASITEANHKMDGKKREGKVEDEKRDDIEEVKEAKGEKDANVEEARREARREARGKKARVWEREKESDEERERETTGRDEDEKEGAKRKRRIEEERQREGGSKEKRKEPEERGREKEWEREKRKDEERERVRDRKRGGKDSEREDRKRGREHGKDRSKGGQSNEDRERGRKSKQMDDDEMDSGSDKETVVRVAVGQHTDKADKKKEVSKSRVRDTENGREMRQANEEDGVKAERSRDKLKERIREMEAPTTDKEGESGKSKVRVEDTEGLGVEREALGRDRDWSKGKIREGEKGDRSKAVGVEGERGYKGKKKEMEKENEDDSEEENIEKLRDESEKNWKHGSEKRSEKDFDKRRDRDYEKEKGKKDKGKRRDEWDHHKEEDRLDSREREKGSERTGREGRESSRRQVEDLDEKREKERKKQRRRSRSPSDSSPETRRRSRKGKSSHRRSPSRSRSMSPRSSARNRENNVEKHRRSDSPNRKRPRS